VSELETRLLIGGEQVAGNGVPLEVENPYTEEPIATVRLPSPDQVNAAVAAARGAARDWASTPAIERGEMLHEVAARLRARTDELAHVTALRRHEAVRARA
jgi:acyl-CoA reductase-like NAD-dependent aldehyde dehydrogenase